MTRALLPFIASAAVFASAPLGAQDSATIQMLELGTPGGSTVWVSAEPHAINAGGDVALTYFRTTGGGHGVSAFLWNRSTGYTLIADNAFATDVNDKGQVVGQFYPCAAPGACDARGFVWSASRGFIDLGTMLPVAINNAGRMVGYCSQLEAYCLRITATNVRRLPSGFTAQDLNERGVVAGSYDRAGGGEGRAALWMSTTGVRVLERSPDRSDSTAISINESSMAAGFGSAETTMPLLFTPFGDVTGPHTPHGQALAISDRGWIVGASGGRPVLWRMGYGLIRLPIPSGTESGFASDVNDEGLVIGAVVTGERSRAVMWVVK